MSKKTKAQDNKSNGFVPLYRSALYHPVLCPEGEPYDTFHMFFDLVACANHEPRTITVRGETFTVERGQKFTSIRKLALRWNRSKEKVVKTLNVFKREGMINFFTTHNGTLITIINYTIYNYTSDTLQDTEQDTKSDTAQDTESPQYNNYKQTLSKNDNKKGGRAWPLYDNRGVLIEE